MPQLSAWTFSDTEGRFEIINMGTEPQVSAGRRSESVDGKVMNEALSTNRNALKWCQETWVSLREVVTY